nr:hypothetical protein [Tanacetum cinerariifolium]
TMIDVTAPTGQAPTMAPPIRSNDQSLPRIRWVPTGYLKFSAKEQVNTMKIQAGIQVQDQENSEDNFTFGRHYLIVFVLVRNIVIFKILPKIEKTVNEQLEAEVLTRASNSSKTSYAVAADLSELELKKILIEKMESNKSIHQSDEQRNLYKAQVDAYECDKIILDTYRDTEKASETSGKSTEGSKSQQKTVSEFAPAEEPMHITQDLEEPAHQEFKTGATDDQPIAEAPQHPEWFQKQTKPLTPDHTWNKTLPATYGPPVSYDKYALWGISHWGHKRQQFYGFAVNRESARDVYSKRRIIAVTELQIVEWHNYKHVDWITVRRDDDRLYKFKKGDFKRLRIQDIEDILLLLVQGKLTNLTVNERFAFNVSLRMFTRSIVI